MARKDVSQLDRALMELRALVLSGAFEEGERLPEVAVAKRLGTSRTPLRQAMDRLVAEGLLERNETGGCRVATFRREDIADAIELRGVIEGTAARLAAERGVDAQMLARAAEVLDRIDIALDPDHGFDFNGYVLHNARFHDLLAAFPGSALVQREIERISLLPLASPSAFSNEQAMIPDFRETLRHAQFQHRGILDAISRREGTRAEALTREHARLALTNFTYLSENRPAIGNAVPGLALLASD